MGTRRKTLFDNVFGVVTILVIANGIMFFIPS